MFWGTEGILYQKKEPPDHLWEFVIDMTLCPVLNPIYTMHKKFENSIVSLKTNLMFLVYTRKWKNHQWQKCLNAPLRMCKITVQCHHSGIMFEDSGRKIIWLLWCHHFQKALFSNFFYRPHYNARLVFSNFLSLKNTSEKLCFRWTISPDCGW